MREDPCTRCGACCAAFRVDFHRSELAGKVGERVACTIYDRRPTPCREFPVYFDDGTPNPKCDELRATIGLPPLPRVDWPRAA